MEKAERLNSISKHMKNEDYKGQFDSEELLHNRIIKSQMIDKTKRRKRKSRLCSNSVLNCLRASYRTISYGNIKIIKDEEIHLIQNVVVKIEDEDEFKNVVSSFPWISYRSDFKEIGDFTTDSGWGCMIRVGQMMLAYTFMQVEKSRYQDPDSPEVHNKVFKEVISQFLDNEEKYESPFSIQNIIPEGEKLYNKTAGIWYGANSVSHCLKICHEKYNVKHNLDMKIRVFSEGIIFQDDISEDLQSCKKLLIIIPQRLGLKRVDEQYFSQINEILGCKLSMGILGGMKSSALYFIGYQDNTLITLDPHYTQVAVDELDEESLKTYQTDQSRNIGIYKMDTTLAFCFLISGKEDKNLFEQMIIDMKDKYKDANLLMMIKSKGQLSMNSIEIENFDL